MHPIIARTFGGLSAAYYVRQFIFGLIFPVFIYLMLSNGNRALQVSTLLLLVVNTLLYPYARFVYESVVGFIMGNNVFFVNAILMLAVKLMTMMLCWVCAIFVAPIGLLYLYYHHSKTER
jgi:hypothetical protein